ncbi:hypothetical protein AM369_00990 [Serratia marcescens]|nr:hypothetical protein AM368_22915 [Serratia marcescens]AWC90849.1 hypothetical protein AM370_18645 [Serratia marcescens]AWS56946.1 hypothetical protein AM369_00990 [Serratia marcescens]AWS68320.1 hypothetical protein AM378_07865 [Serratia marcescens]
MHFGKCPLHRSFWYVCSRVVPENLLSPISYLLSPISYLLSPISYLLSRVFTARCGLASGERHGRVPVVPYATERKQKIEIA